ncbi:MAG: hypothetical protein DMG16_03740, partial [Acidobacteria bacterium]
MSAAARNIKRRAQPNLTELVPSMRKWSAPELRKSKLEVEQKEIPMSVSKTKVSPIRAVMGFNALTDANLVVLANGVLKGLTGNASFPN